MALWWRFPVNAARTKPERRARAPIEIIEDSRWALNSGARGREFKSPRSDQQNQQVTRSLRTSVGGNVGEFAQIEHQTATHPGR